ncbi:MAG: YifB family Mg chelatase-like AAA ATPase [bacterium]|nr:ATP-binding protein [Planctomycetota bacterium]HIL51265.1 ATP-binding protein [Planctomycetota bacterium]
MQAVRVQGISLQGTGADLVSVEARFESRDTGPTEVSISGLPDPVIRESRGRWMCALKESRLALRPGHLFLNLVPSARRKSGGSLDLAMALAAAAASGHLDAKWLEGTLFLGELGIDGRLHSVPGGLAAAAAARDGGLSRVMAPPATAREAAWLPEIEAHAASSLGQVVQIISGVAGKTEAIVPREMSHSTSIEVPSLDEVRGQELAKRALQIAAAGGHGLLLVGPPGAGKSMLARRLPGLLPTPTVEERIEITRVLSAAGTWPGGLARARPFRAPHHTTSYAGLVGGGSTPAPGEITLAHRGVLFLDELPEFRREALEALRQPLETGQITISRASGRLDLPARFQLVAAMNPCPCGYLGHGRVTCHCTEAAVARYRRRISGPLLDRIDLRLEIRPPEFDELLGRSYPRGKGSAEDPQDAGRVPTPSHAASVIAAASARERSFKRQGPTPNCGLSAAQLDRFVVLDSKSLQLLEGVAQRTALSARGLQSLRRVARTLADLDGTAAVTVEHLAQAVGLRGALEAQTVPSL